MNKISSDIKTERVKGFTLLEIVLTLAVLSLILAVFVSVGNPLELFKTARDNQRLSDLNALKIAVLNYIENATTTIDLDGPFLTGKGVDESSRTIFISVASDIENVADTFVDASSTIWAVNQVVSATLTTISGSGWLPINFKELPKKTISKLPLDPVNLYSQKNFYSYVFRRYDNSFEINANLESVQLSSSGANDQESKDSGDNDNLYEVGSNFNLMPSGFY
jgi:prepilin-type N-terminal cleavage/methylation domain-containing protein